VCLGVISKLNSLLFRDNFASRKLCNLKKGKVTFDKYVPESSEQTDYTVSLFSFFPYAYLKTMLVIMFGRIDRAVLMLAFSYHEITEIGL
jgi:hypothetical protein